MKKVESINWFCPALEKLIDEGLCWELCFADAGGPTDTRDKLKKWIEKSKNYKDISDFHRICKSCEHCQWNEK